jgi:hypothetical protein
MSTATATRSRAAAKAVKQVTAALAPPKLGEIIDRMFDTREKKRKLDGDIAKLEAELKEDEELLLERMKAEATDKAAGKKASASITMGVVANVEDWAKVEAFVKKTGNFQLFQRRISDPAFRELMERRGAVPGITPFEKRKLNLRVLST